MKTMEWSSWRLFTSTTPWKSRNVKIFQKVWNWRNWILSVATPSFRMSRKKKSPWLRQYQSYISNWYVNGKVSTNTTTWEPKNLIFFSKKFEIEFDLYFHLCWRAEIIQVGLNMHLYVDIWDASSSLWGSTSSFKYEICNLFLAVASSFWILQNYVAIRYALN